MVSAFTKPNESVEILQKEGDNWYDRHRYRF